MMKNTMPDGMISNETSFFGKLQEDDVKQQYGVIMHSIKLSKSLSPRIATVLWDTDRANAHTLSIECQGPWRTGICCIMFQTHTAKITSTFATQRDVHTSRFPRERSTCRVSIHIITELYQIPFT
jgi:hypothetical protein